MDTVSLYRRVSPNGLMKNNGMNEPCLVNTVHNKTTKLAVLFALVGAMMILLVPILIEQGYAKTTGVARDNGPVDRHFSNIKYHLDFGRWVQVPTFVGSSIEWKTRGAGITGNEKGFVSADYGFSTITFYFNNPVVGKNSCNIVVSGPPVSFLPCRITSGQNVVAEYIVVKP